MTRAMLQAYNRAQTNIILGSTSLKIKVELRVDGISMECGEFESIPQMKSWVRAKVKQWREMSAGTELDFVAL